jgi:hypothetical protein
MNWETSRADTMMSPAPLDASIVMLPGVMVPSASGTPVRSCTDWPQIRAEVADLKVMPPDRTSSPTLSL